MISGSIPRGSPRLCRSESVPGGDRSPCELSARAHLTCGAIGFFVTLCLSVLTFAFVVSLAEGLGVLSTTAVVLGFAGLWTIAWIAAEVSLLRWGNRLPLPIVKSNSENGDSRP